MQKLKWCSALFVGVCLVFSCSGTVEIPIENTKSGIERLEDLQYTFKYDLKEAIVSMSANAEPLLSSAVFNDEVVTSYAVNYGDAVDAKSNIFDDDAIFDSLSDEEKHKIEILAKQYFDNVQELAKTITVFDQGLPEGVTETDEYIEYEGIQYSKCVKETLEIAYAIRESLYNSNAELVQGAKSWAIPRWHLIDAPLGAIFYSYDSAFTKDEKEAIRYAMDEWESATDEAVRFYEKPLNWWGKVKWGMGIVRNVRIVKKHYGINNADAWSTTGCLPWGRVWINIDRMFRNTDLKYYSKGWKSEWSETHGSLIHELGHTIGLSHEFARSDRDEYIELGNPSPDPSNFLRFWQKVSMRNYGSYDYLSCMNYSGFYKVKDTDRWIHFADIRNISHNDALTVKYIYSRISYRELLNNWQETKSIILGE